MDDGSQDRFEVGIYCELYTSSDVETTPVQWLDFCYHIDRWHAVNHGHSTDCEA